LVDFRISVEFPGWTEAPVEGYADFTPNNLYDLINGGATPYIDNGLAKGFRQKLSGDSGREYGVMAMDFETAEKAETIYELKRNGKPNKTALGTYGPAVAFGFAVWKGIEGYAHFGKYYFEAVLTGVADSATAQSEMGNFIGFYESKTAQ
jgi:hypothetical protein